MFCLTPLKVTDMFAFEMTVEVAQEFYRRATALGAITEEQKTHLLLQMVEEGLIKNVLQTDATKEQFKEALGKHFNLIGDTDEKPDTESETDSGQIGTNGN